MCYSQKSSIIAYSIGMISAILALATGQYILGTLILFFVQTQLAEFFIWKGIDESNTSLNKFGTAYLKYTLPSHNIAIGLGIIITVLVSGKKLTLKDMAALIIGIIFYIVVLLIYAENQTPNLTYPLDGEKCDRFCQNSKNRLVYPFPCKWYMLGFIITLILIFKQFNLNSEIFISLVFIMSLAISITFFDWDVSGSIWCFSAAIAAPLLVLGNYIIMKNNLSVSTSALVALIPIPP